MPGFGKLGARGGFGSLGVLGSAGNTPTSDAPPGFIWLLGADGAYLKGADGAFLYGVAP
jgi:hypothetical protein